MSRRDPFIPFRVRKKTQLTTKSDQWFKDAKYLHEKAKRYDAAVYLGGFVVECLLKAALWARRREKQVEVLLYSHDLTRLLEVNVSLANRLRAEPQDLYQQFVRVANWNVGIRYNPAAIQKADADDFMRRLKEVQEWLRQSV